jgi:PPOX class probable F420-dependent enzyme
LNRLLDWPAGARELVDSLEVARLATVEADGQPHVVPICFVVHRDSLYSVIDAKPKRRPLSLKRLRNIAANPRATVVADRYDADWTRLAWAMLSGRASVVDDDAEYADVIARLKAKYAQYHAMHFARAAQPLLRLQIDNVRFWSYSTAEAL